MALPFIPVYLIAGTTSPDDGPETQVFKFVSTINPATGVEIPDGDPLYEFSLAEVAALGIKIRNPFWDGAEGFCTGLGIADSNEKAWPDLYAIADHDGTADAILKRFEQDDANWPSNGYLDEIDSDSDSVLDFPIGLNEPHSWKGDIFVDDHRRQVFKLPAWVDWKTIGLQTFRHRARLKAVNTGTNPTGSDSTIDLPSDTGCDQQRIGTVGVIAKIAAASIDNLYTSPGNLQIRIEQPDGTALTDWFTDAELEFDESGDYAVFSAWFHDPETVGDGSGTIRRFSGDGWKASAWSGGYRIAIASTVQTAAMATLFPDTADVSVEFHCSQGGHWDERRPPDMAPTSKVDGDPTYYNCDAPGTSRRYYPWLFAGVDKNVEGDIVALDVRNRTSCCAHGQTSAIYVPPNPPSGSLPAPSGDPIYVMSVLVGQVCADAEISETESENPLYYPYWPGTWSGPDVGVGTPIRIWTLSGADGSGISCPEITLGGSKIYSATNIGIAGGLAIDRKRRDCLAALVYYATPGCSASLNHKLARVNPETGVVQASWPLPEAVQFAKAIRGVGRGIKPDIQPGGLWAPHWPFWGRLQSNLKGPLSADNTQDRTTACSVPTDPALAFPDPDPLCRAFGSEFQDVVDADPPLVCPYYVLKINWTSGSRYYVDRPPALLVDKVPASDVYEAVLDWSQLRAELNEKEIGTTQNYKIKLFDGDYAIRDIFDSAPQQGVGVELYMGWDLDGFVWADAEILFCGHIRQPSWVDHEATIVVDSEQAVRDLRKTVGKPAAKSIFPGVPPEYEDQILPIVWGCCKRVPAVLVDVPWETQLLDGFSIENGVVTPSEITIVDHPDDIGIPTGSSIDVMVGRDKFQATFTQSGDPDNSPSYFEIDSYGFVLGQAVVMYLHPWDANPIDFDVDRRDVILNYNAFYPRRLGGARLNRFDQYHEDADAKNYLRDGMSIRIRKKGSYTRIETTLAEWEFNEPYRGFLRCRFPEGVSTTLGAGDVIEFLDDTKLNAVYRPGERVRELDQTWTYVANMLPSKGVQLVEGWGKVATEEDEAENGFVAIGYMTDPTAGSQTPTEWIFENLQATVDLNDSTWAAGLGHNVTSIKFTQNPRSANPSISDQRIWVTLQGITDDGTPAGDVITNPARVVEEYLLNQHLGNISTSNVDSDSFDHAATCLADIKVGFAQLDYQDLLTYCQAIGIQAAFSLQVDRCKIRPVMLRVDATAPGLTLTQADVYMDSFQISEQSIDSVPTIFGGKFQNHWDDKEGQRTNLIVRENSAATAAIGRRALQFDQWIYSRTEFAELFVDHARDRLSRVFWYVEFKLSIPGLCLRPGDWFRLTYTDGESNAILTSQDMEVLSTTFDPRGLSVTVSARFAKFEFS